MREWLSFADLAALALPDMPSTKPGLLGLAARKGWLAEELRGRSWRPRAGRGGGVEIHVSVLPSTTQAALACKLAPAKAVPARARAKAALAREARWADLDRLSDKKKARAAAKLAALDAVETMVRAGTGRVLAMQLVAQQAKVRLSTLYAWAAAARSVAREDRLAVLAPAHAGRQAEVECPDEAWELLKADYLRQEAPNFSDCYRRLEKVAAVQGWRLPAERTLLRRIEALPAPMRVLLREGDDALKRMYPAQERDRSALHALEAVNADGHTWDVFVRWEDGTVGRPVMCAFQDLHSGLLLSWRVDRSESKHTIRLAFGDLVERYGIPDHCVFDNGRSFASKWLTGGVANRYRFKVREEDPQGILTALGVEVHWAQPYSGQSKPIERAFRDFAQGLAKHPAFAGAYTGNSPDAKPENYGAKAVPIATFLEVVAAGIAEHNTRIGRRSKVCGGRLSFQQAFDASYSTALIRRPTAAQQRLWLMAAEAIRTGARDGAISFLENRYWGDFLSEHRGQRVVVRFDPADLHNLPLHVYRLDGVYLGAAECVHAAGFLSMDAAREQARKFNAYRRFARDLAKAEVSMGIEEVAAACPAAVPPPAPPAPKLVRLVAGGAALRTPPVAAEEFDDQPADEKVLVRAMFRPRLVSAEGGAGE